MASQADQPPEPQVRTGIVRGAPRGRPPGSAPRWLPAVVVGILAVVMLALIANLLAGGTPGISEIPTFTATPTPTPVSSLPTFVQETPAPTPSPSPSPTPSPTPTPSPSPAPTPSPTPTPTPTPTPEPFPTATPLPTPPPSGLLILEPANESTVSDPSVVIRGLAQPFTQVTRELPLWFDEHTEADASGRWAFVEQLNNGRNEFTFHASDDQSTTLTLVVFYVP